MSEASVEIGEPKQTRISWWWALALAAVVALLIGSLGWCLESWMFQENACRIPEWVWISCAAAGALGLVVIAACYGSRRHRWSRTALALAFASALIGGFRWAGCEFAVGQLFHCGEITGSYDTPDSWAQKLVKWLDAKSIPCPPWLKKKAEEYHSRDSPPQLRHLISYSRWPVRRAFLKRMMKDDEHAFYLVQYWYDVFPAITGADVDLIQRREMMSILRKFSGDSSLTEKSRQAATLWMGLVFLTDPKEFASSRVSIRDAMLAYTAPNEIIYRYCWMRVLDTLLAYDPPSALPDLTKPLTSHPATLRLAVRERVRGVISHFDAIVRESDASVNSGDWSGAFALWQDTGRWLAAHPGTAGEARVKEWRRDTIFQWLKTDKLGTKWNIPDLQNDFLVDLSPEDVTELSPEQESVLYAKSCEWSLNAVNEALNAMDTTGQDRAHTALEHVRILHAFLTKAHQDDISRRITPALIRTHVYSRKREYVKIQVIFDTCNRCSDFLGKTWHAMSPEDLKTLCENSRMMLASYPLGSHILCIDAWSDSPAFSEEEWLLYAIAFTGRCKILPRDTPMELVEIPAYKPIPIPPVRDEVIRKVIGKLKTAIIDEDEQVFEARALKSNLNSLLGEKSLLPVRFMKLLYTDGITAREFRSSSFLGFENWMKIKLYLVGLTEADDALLPVLAQQVQGNTYLGKVLLSLPPGGLDPWSSVLKSPEIASQSLEQLIGCSDNRLQSLLSAAIASPPSDEVVRAMWNTLRGRLATTEKLRDKLTIYGALMHLAPLLPQEDRLAMRQDFLGFFRATPVPINGWPLEVMFDIRQPRVRWSNGEGIPWEDDPLSAALSWSSAIGKETDPDPEYGEAEKSGGVFSYLTQAKAEIYEGVRLGTWNNPFEISQPAPSRMWKRKPLHAPFEPTPWQRARDLHLRRPDLRIPDPAWSRPGERSR